ncbi:MAG: hypothetical protein JRI23_18950 [Deltaproteobacteria bacterium]|jgi:hypothetical protein|nr:hypothetical protein [Deltaproteobacteria bacterium]MBW2533943.1 hypothetical protein [Deltaproteobacteria bacterium]
MGSPVQRWLATVPGLADHELRIRYARSELYERDARAAAESLNELCALSEQVDVTAQEVLTAFVPVIVDPDHIARLSEIRAQVVSQALPSASRLLRSSTPAGHRPPPRAMSDDSAEQAAQATLTHGDGRPLTLGERRALARRPTRSTLNKMMSDPHPMVLRILLGNPKITEEDVVRMATRRPAVPAVLAEIAKTWTRRARVRMAVVLNPGAPPAVSVPVLSLLAGHELRQVIRSTQLAAVVRATASEFAAIRPPPGAVERPSVVH